MAAWPRRSLNLDERSAMVCTLGSAGGTLNVDGAILGNVGRLLNLGGGTFGKAGHALNSDNGTVKMLGHSLNLGDCIFEIGELSSKVAGSLNSDEDTFGMD